MARYYSGQNQPLGTWNNLPIYLTTILTGVFIVGLLGTAMMMSTRSPLLGLLTFEMPLRPAWSIWRLFTYVFVDRVSFFTPFSIIFFYWMSVGIETHLGRAVLARLLILLALALPAVAAFSFFVLKHDTSFLVAFEVGNYLFMSGLLIAFATLYPKTEAFGWVPFKWVAFACVVCGSIMLMAQHFELGWEPLAALWVSCLVGFLCIRQANEQEYDDYESPLLKLKQYFRRKPKLRVMPPPSEPSRYREPVKEPTSELDVLLDKISKSGMDSLTPKERAQLQKAREALMRKDQH